MSGGELNHRGETEPVDGRLTDLAVRVELLSAQRPAPAAQQPAATEPGSGSGAVSSTLTPSIAAP